ncbi:MAG: hypothetical protein LBH43_12375 [Treponema sp.]|jgi:hypothetical protein|nr:hypothetical protein [Treponema sp.]
MKRNIGDAVLTIFFALFVLSFVACPIDNPDNGGISKNIENSGNDEPSIIYTSEDWNKNENSIPYVGPNIPWLNCYEYVEDDNLYPQKRIFKFWVASSVDELKTAINKLTAFFPRYHLENSLNEFNESYFTENILILWDASEGSGSIGNWVDSIDINGETLTINTLRYSPFGQNCMVASKLYTIQVKKADIAGVTKVEMVTRNVRYVPESVTVWILDEYIENEFTVKDFKWDNIAKISRDSLYSPMRLIMLDLKEPGTKNAYAACEHIKKLYFVRGVWVE